MCIKVPQLRTSGSWQVGYPRYAEELRLREFEARMEGELGSPSCTTLDATAVRARR